MTNSGIHGLHWYPASFVSAIPGTVIPYITNVGDTVVDPFMGSGTTGVEALRLGRRFWGVDSNPVAVMITESKLAFPDVGNMAREQERLLRVIERAREKPVQLSLERHLAFDWYEPRTLLELSFLYEYIRTVKSVDTQRLLFMTFSSILRTCTSQQKHWGWICDNVTPTKLLYIDAISEFFDSWSRNEIAFERFLRDTRLFNPRTPIDSMRRRADIRLGDALQEMGKLATESVESIVTSPPYFGVADYVKSQRLTFQWIRPGDLPWFGGDAQAFEGLRKTELGSRSFRHRAEAYKEYVAYMSRFMEEAARILKPSGWLALVFGASRRRRSPIDDVLAIAGKSGLTTTLEVLRSIPKNRRRLRAQVPNERVILFQKAPR